MASIRSPKSIFLSNGKVREGLATLMGLPVKELKFKVLCNFSDSFETADFQRTCQRTGPCFILIQKPSSSEVLGGFTRMGWGTQYGTNHVDREAFLFLSSSDFASVSGSKYVPVRLDPTVHLHQPAPGFQFGANYSLPQTQTSYGNKEAPPSTRTSL
jgi:hypothetical protein